MRISAFLWISAESSSAALAGSPIASKVPPGPCPDACAAAAASAAALFSAKSSSALLIELSSEYALPTPRSVRGGSKSARASARATEQGREGGSKTARERAGERETCHLHAFSSVGTTACRPRRWPAPVPICSWRSKISSRRVQVHKKKMHELDTPTPGPLPRPRAPPARGGRHRGTVTVTDSEAAAAAVTVTVTHAD